MRLLVIVSMVISAIVGYILIKDFIIRDRAYNRHMCAVYGYYEDCKTPLRPEDRLK